MSDMKGNPYQHFEEASALLANNPGEYEIEKSKALATLAVAYEQRTANLFALFHVAEDAVPALHAGGMNDDAWVAAARQITKRLGLS